jgi:hypothetical protein
VFSTAALSMPAVGTVVARYNVTNTTTPRSPVPPWDTFELGYTDMGAYGMIMATLYKVSPCSGESSPICTITSVPSPSSTCLTCGFPARTINFATDIYIVEVTVQRFVAGTPPLSANTLRIYNTHP